jgi:hypothetical protein
MYFVRDAAGTATLAAVVRGAAGAARPRGGATRRASLPAPGV